MEIQPPKLAIRCQRYAEGRSLTFETQLGYGFDGTVFSTSRQSAVKFHKHHSLYERERDVYRRLQSLGMERVKECAIPVLLDADDELSALEMSLVQPPYVLDFAGARLDRPHDFPTEVWEEWQADKQDQFGSDWPRVRSIMAVLQGHGIYLGDVNPRNICLRSAQ